MEMGPPSCPLATGSREPEKWNDWSGQLKSYVSLYKPSTRSMMDRFFCVDQHIEDYGQQSPGQQLIVFSGQLPCFLAQITDGRLNEGGNGFEIWRKLHDRFSLPDRGRGVSRDAQSLGHDLSEFYEGGLEKGGFSKLNLRKVRRTNIEGLRRDLKGGLRRGTSQGGLKKGLQGGLEKRGP